MSDAQLKRPFYKLNVPQLSVFRWRRAWLTMDQNQHVINFAKSGFGVVVLHLAFFATLAGSMQFSIASLVMIVATMIAIAVVPKMRLQIMTISSVAYVVLRPFRINEWRDILEAKSQTLAVSVSPLVFQVAGVASFLLLAFLFLKAMKWQQTKFIAKRPIASLIIIWASILIAAYFWPDQTMLDAYFWAFAAVMISSIWLLAYAAVDEKSKDTTPTIARVGLMRPFWGGGSTPIGKSYGYLNKFDAKDDAELAVSRLKAIKLVVWALILKGVMLVSESVVRDMYGVPILQDAIIAHANGNSFATNIIWASVIYNYFIDLIYIAVWGHFIVAIIRMLGYRIPRNTRNPMAARTLADFWNRYYFYFKELLVDFFFYPAFVRYFKKTPKLRIAFATFCAAGLGNFFYHFSRDSFQFVDHSIVETLLMFQSAAFYSLLLAIGLIMSQLNPYKVKPSDGFIRYEILTRLNVFVFFCFVRIFDDTSGEGTIVERTTFMVDLFKI